MKNPVLISQKVGLVVLVFVLSFALSPAFGLVNKAAEIDVVDDQQAPVLSEPPSQTATASISSAYTPGEFIIKIKEGPASQAIDQNLLNPPLGTSVVEANPTQTGVASLDQLNNQFQVIQMTAAFNDLKTKQLATGKSSQEIYQDIKNKYPKRLQRIPQNATLPNLLNIYKLKLQDSQTDISVVCAAYSQDSNVEFCQPNYIIEANPFKSPSKIPEDDGRGGGNSDPYLFSQGSWGQPSNRGDYDDLWGLKKIRANLTWDVSQGQGSVVAVVDTGIDYTHPDIANNVWVNPGEDLNHNGIVDGTNNCWSGEANGDFNCIDDDGNGYIDDMRGYNFSYSDNDPWDDHGHGTHVSGTIAAIRNNGIGIVGVAPKAKIMACKGLNSLGSGYSDILAIGLIYAAANGADVINNSWGCRYRCPSNSVVEDAIRTAYGLGAVVVFAAGNSNDDASYYSPQNMSASKPIVVSAINHDDMPTSFSNFGASVDVGAPGGGVVESPPNYQPVYNILSLKATGGWFPTELIVGNDYVRLAGTSMAAPHVSGLTALILPLHSNYTNEDIRQLIRLSANPIGNPNYGTGRIDSVRSLAFRLAYSEITSPSPSMTLNPAQQETVDILGTATGPDFQSYQLFYGAGGSPTEFIPLADPVFTPVTNGNLGIWQIGALPNGSYTLKLVATAIDGSVFPDTVSLSVECPLLYTITSPASNATLTQQDGTVTLRGSATGRNFQNYEVFYGQGSSPTTWASITGPVTTPIIDATLGTWTIRDLSDGPYALKLVLTLLNEPYESTLPLILERFQISQITSNLDSQWFPAVSGNRIVWEDTRNGNSDIYLYDFTTGVERQITTDSQFQGYPDISGNYIVWQDDRGYDIYLYDLAQSLERRITTNGSSQFDPAVSGNRIVWTDYRNGASDIYMCTYNSSTGSCPEQRITTNSTAQWSPAISADKIVWADERNGNMDIYLYDLTTSTERRITTNSSRQDFPDISLNNIVWEDYRNGNTEIYMCTYDPATGVCPEVRITNNAAWKYRPHISGDRLCWEDNRSGNWDIYLYDLAISKEYQVTADPETQSRCDIGLNRIVWRDSRSHTDWDIYETVYNPQ